MQSQFANWKSVIKTSCNIQIYGNLITESMPDITSAHDEYEQPKH
jgi:hypothetical protein